MAGIPDVDLSKVGTTKFGSFEVEVVDYTTEYFDTLKVGAAAAVGCSSSVSSGCVRVQPGVQCRAARHAPCSKTQPRRTSCRPSCMHYLFLPPP